MRLLITIPVLFLLADAAYAQRADDATFGRTNDGMRLNELQTAPKPKQASDIDTLQLASAHRERAASVDEKTNGLWQSWTTSICEGCGNTPSYRETVRNDFENRRGIAARRLEANLGSKRRGDSQTSQLAPERRSLYTDLSNENIDQIRRMPGQ